MTERMIRWINDEYGRGLIIVSKFDEKVEEYLKYYETLQCSHNQRLVRDVYTKKLFTVVRASENTRGRRTSHMILDSRIDDEFIEIIAIPMLVGMNRKVEIF